MYFPLELISCVFYIQKNTQILNRILKSKLKTANYKRAIYERGHNWTDCIKFENNSI